MRDINATVIVDLKPTKEEDLLKSFSKSARRGIKEAIENGLKIEEAKEESDWNAFYEIYKKTMEEGKDIPETLEHIKEHGKVLFLCKKEGKIIGGAVLDIKDNLPMLNRSGSLKEYRMYSPGDLLYWHCIKWCKEKGYKKLDLCGWQIKARGHLKGVNQFKEKWGKVIYYYKDYPFLKAIGRKLIRNLGIFWRIWNKIKK